VFGKQLAYLCAGGEAALLKSQESAEDVSAAAVADLALLLDGVKGMVVYIGVSCGMSATYVGAQAEYLLAQPPSGGVCVSLMGFNPLELVPEKAIQGWSGTFKAVATAVKAAGMHPPQKGVATGALITPVLGPEAIAGSTRMKGGSATKILLEAVLASAGAAAVARLPGISSEALMQRLASAQSAVHSMYRYAHCSEETTFSRNATLTTVASAAAASLQAGGRLLYLGVGSAGVLGMIDASECPPTFGADFDDVRGFVQGGYHCLGSAETSNTIPATNVSGSRDDAPGKRLIAEDGAVQWEMSGLVHFREHVCASLTAADTVVLLQCPTTAPPGSSMLEQAALLEAAAAAAAASPAKLCGICVLAPGQEAAAWMQHAAADMTLYISVASSMFGPPLLHPEGELALKLCLNAVTTLAHVQRGCVYGNRMINVGVTNAKLLVRAVGIIADVAAVPRSVASTALLRCILGNDQEVVQDAHGEHDAEAVPGMVAVASQKRSLVPLSILMCAAARGAASGIERGADAITAALPTVQATAEVLSAHPVLRGAIQAALSKC